MGVSGGMVPIGEFNHNRNLINCQKALASKQRNQNQKLTIKSNKRQKNVDQNIIKEENINLDLRILDNNFKKQYHCKYEQSQLQKTLLDFIEKLNIQDSFFTNNNSEDYSFNLLKQKEKKDLTKFFQSNLPKIKELLKEKIKEIKFSKNQIKEIADKILGYENAKEVYSEKIKNEISRIKEDKSIFEIKYLTVMILGKRGVGKSTLINNLLKLEGKNKAITGSGDPQTMKTKEYQNEEVSFLRLVDTRGIELNLGYGAKEVKAQAEKYINEQNNTGDPNNFVQCIWYCITGNSFEKVEIDLLNSLRKAYGNNKIPIIIIYTQTTDIKSANDMKKHIRKKNIEADFIQVLAERKELVNNNYIEPFGLDDLIKETLKNCKTALRGDMRSLMTNKIEKTVSSILKDKDAYITKYINEVTILDFISNYNYVKNEENFINYIIYIFGYNNKYFLNKEMNKKSVDYYKSIDFIQNKTQNYIDYYKAIVDKTIKHKLKEYAIDFLDYQVIIQKKEKKDININNKRCLNDFIQTTTNFLNDNFYYIAQEEYINFILTIYGVFLTHYFKKNLERIIMEELKTNNIQNLIDKCFTKKFDEFEKRANDSFDNIMNNNIIIQSYNENFINGQNNDLPSYSETTDSNPYNKIFK